MPITVLVADDHPVVRSGIRNELRRHKDIRVVGEALDGDQAVAKTKELQPQVLLLDIRMPGMKATAVIHAVAELPGAPDVLVLSAFGEPEIVIGMLKAGAKGYLLKEAEPTEIVEGIRAVARGGIWLSPSAARVLVEASTEKKAVKDEKLLSAREQEILRMMGGGNSNGHIARELGISERTVKNYVSKIYEELELHSRAEAVAWAWENGLVGK
jgi:DNA-binding NarL/FixJ family response regulator